MKSNQDYINDLSEIRAIMERSTKFLSLTGLSGILAGIYALGAVFIVDRFFNETGKFTLFQPPEYFQPLILIGLIVLVLAVGTAVLLSYRKAAIKKARLWTMPARRLVLHMSIPLITGGVLILVLLLRGMGELAAPLTLIFYGLALINASEFTFKEIRHLGMIQVILGLLSAYFIGWSLIFWALGFGLMHIAYGTAMHFKYER